MTYHELVKYKGISAIPQGDLLGIKSSFIGCNEGRLAAEVCRDQHSMQY